MTFSALTFSSFVTASNSFWTVLSLLSNKPRCSFSILQTTVSSRFDGIVIVFKSSAFSKFTLAIENSAFSVLITISLDSNFGSLLTLTFSTFSSGSSKLSSFSIFTFSLLIVPINKGTANSLSFSAFSCCSFTNSKLAAAGFESNSSATS